MNGLTDLLETTIKRGYASMKPHVGDFINEDGLTICGVCKEKREIYVGLPNNQGVTSMRKVYCCCNCDRDAQSKIAAEKDHEMELARISGLRKASLMDVKYADARFSNFVTTKSNEKNLKICKRYATGFEEMLERNQGLLLWGNVGTGKSFAAACIANYLIEKKIPVVMTSFVKILEIIQKGSENETDVFNKLEKAKLVIFDDLGAERNTEYALEKVYNLIDDRNRKRLPMILTTNLTLDEMKDERDIRYMRIYDRIFETCYPVQFTGQSWRRKAAGKSFNEMEVFFKGGE